MTVVTRPLFRDTIRFAEPEDIRRVSAEPAINGRVVALQGVYYTVNVTQAMTSLAKIGPLLQVAFAGSRGFRCHAPISGILCDYQTLVKKTFVASGAFVGGSLEALKTCRRAVTFAQADDLSRSMAEASKCGETATKMIEQCTQLISGATELCSQSRDAIVKAAEDHCLTVEQRQTVQKMLDDTAVQQADLGRRSETLEHQLAEIQAQERKIIKEIKKEERRAHALTLMRLVGPALLSTVFGGGATLPALAAAAEGAIRATSSRTAGQAPPPPREAPAVDSASAADEAPPEAVLPASGLRDRFDGHVAALREQAIELRKLQVEVHGQLAEAVERLKRSSVEKDNLDKAIYSLDVVMKTMGKVKTVFENIRMFWLGIKAHCEYLSDADTRAGYAALGLKEEYIDELHDLGFNWLVLGKTCLEAHQGFAVVNEGIDRIMTDLPTEEEGRRLIEAYTVEVFPAVVG